MITTLLIQCVDDIRSGAYSLSNHVNSAKAAWDDVNYDRIAQGAASAIDRDTQSFCSNARTDAEQIYTLMNRIDSLLGEL